MKSGYPRVYLIAVSMMDTCETAKWLMDVGGHEAKKMSPTDHSEGGPEKLIELAARRCYKSFAPQLNPNVTRIREDSEKYLENILSSGHGSVLEHATCTWAFEDVSRVFTHELVRNRAGNAFSQESLRYVRLDDLTFWIPPEISSNAEAEAIFVEVVEKCEAAQKKLAQIFNLDEKVFATKKKITSAMRRVAPIGLSTGIVLTTNMRSLRWLIEQRTSEAAEIEIRIAFNKVARIAKSRWPMIFQDFEKVMSGPEMHDNEGASIVEWVPKYHKV